MTTLASNLSSWFKECNGSPIYFKQILCRSEVRTSANDLLILAK